MTVARLRAALENIAEPTSCQGTTAVDNLTITLPGGDRRTATGEVDGDFVAWLLAHSEPAPFGDGKETKLDPAVRRTQRLVARGAVELHGFTPPVTEIAGTLAPRATLHATLTDVLVYPGGGRFARHKDTPRGEQLLGTLIVCLPIGHRGGAMRIDDGVTPIVVDWSGEPDPQVVRWVAVLGDVDHTIETVLAGARVTAVFALTRDHQPAAPMPRLEPVRAALTELLADATFLPKGGALLVPCSRHVIAPRDAPPTVDGLRGLDRDLVDLCEALALPVALRPCLAVVGAEGANPAAHRVPEGDVLVRLREPLTPKIIAKFGEAVTLAEQATFEDEDLEATSLAKYLLQSYDDGPDDEAWVTRRNAAGTFIHETLFSADGQFGNEHFDAWIYTLVALEVTVGTLAERGIVLPSPARRRVRHAKFGDGEVIATHGGGVLEIRFDSGEVKKLVERFVQPI